MCTVIINNMKNNTSIKWMEAAAGACENWHLAWKMYVCVRVCICVCECVCLFVFPCLLCVHKQNSDTFGCLCFIKLTQFIFLLRPGNFFFLFPSSSSCGIFRVKRKIVSYAKNVKWFLFCAKSSFSFVKSSTVSNAVSCSSHTVAHLLRMNQVDELE